MLAIETTYLGPTSTKGARIKATVHEGCASVTIPRRYQDDVWNDVWADYRRAVEKLCEKLGWDGEYVGGVTKRGAIWVCMASAPHRVTI